MPEIVIPASFRKRLKKKPPEMVAAVVECVSRLAENPAHPGLQTHRIRGTDGIWEAYVDRANRVTFEYGDDCIILRNHCNHTIIERAP